MTVWLSSNRLANMVLLNWVLFRTQIGVATHQGIRQQRTRAFGLPVNWGFHLRFHFYFYCLPVRDTLFLPLSCLSKGPREVFNEVTLLLHVEKIGFSFCFSAFFVSMDLSQSYGYWKMLLLRIWLLVVDLGPVRHTKNTIVFPLLLSYFSQ